MEDWYLTYVECSSSALLFIKTPPSCSKDHQSFVDLVMYWMFFWWALVLTARMSGNRWWLLDVMLASAFKETSEHIGIYSQILGLIMFKLMKQWTYDSFETAFLSLKSECNDENTTGLHSNLFAPDWLLHQVSLTVTCVDKGPLLSESGFQIPIMTSILNPSLWSAVVSLAPDGLL